ncbi:MAG: hypothetical protein WCL02_01675 [bacterium]
MKIKILFAMIVIIIFASCGNKKSQQTQTIIGQDGKQYVVVDSISQLLQSTICDGQITDFGNGVYYFGYINADFGNHLSSFIQQHTELSMVAFAPNDALQNQGSNVVGTGQTFGYFVYFKPNVPYPGDTIKK